jgi:hypothetical protein
VAVEKVSGVGDNFVAADGVISATALGAVIFRDNVRTIKCVVQAAPAGIRCIQGVAGVHYGDHQLGAGEARHFLVHIFTADAEVIPLRQQVADVLQECLVGHAIVFGARVGAVPVVDFCLHFVPGFQQFTITGRQAVNNLL